MTPELHVLDGGAFTTVQDFGRFGAQYLGVPVSGALDPVSLRLANALVGNPQETAGLEIRMLGPRFRVGGAPVRVALVGTTAPLEILAPNTSLVPAGQSIMLQPNTEFRVRGTPDTATCVLGVEGGFDLKPVLRSLSTYAPARIGGVEGRALMVGDCLKLCKAATARFEYCLPKDALESPQQTIRVVLGPQDDRFAAEAIATLLNEPFTVSSASNRMGLRLDGTALEHSGGYDLASDGIVSGSIQVPGDGQPIVLLADRQTTGGYPKIATVVSADVPFLGKLRPGDHIRFKAVSVSKAEDLARRKNAWMSAVVEKIAPVQPSVEARSAVLRSSNLISGMVRGDENERS